MTTYIDEQRTSILGGEVARRDFLGVPPPVLAAWTLAAVCAVGSFIIIGAGWWGVGTGAFIIIGTVAATLELKGEKSWAAIKVHQLRTRLRRRAGHHVFVTPTDEAYGDDELDPGWEIPVPLGKAWPLDLSGTGLDDMFIIEHNNPGSGRFYTVVLALEGVSDGILGDADWANRQLAFSTTLRGFAKRSSMIRRIGMLHRSVPADLTPHVRWADREINRVVNERRTQLEQLAALEDSTEAQRADALRILADEDALREQAVLELPVASYADLLSVASVECEEHYSYATLVFPAMGELSDRAARLARRKDASYIGGVAAVIRDETIRAIDALRDAHLGSVTMLGEQRACAVFRALIDPSYKLDAHRGARWPSCFPSYIGGEESVLVSPRSDTPWHVRVGEIPPGSIAPTPLGPLWLSPLLTGVTPATGDSDTPPSPTIRTVSVVMDFVVEHVARDAAKGDVTDDMARQHSEAKKERISDGSAEVMASSSMRRRMDLMPGSGHHGVIYTMWVSVAARSLDDLDAAETRMSEAASNSAIGRITWQTDDHDIAVFNTLPLGRGLAPNPKFTRRGLN
ncbi:hypothetical protein [Gordonia sp. N1V]|uniref:hypothetical protein n=1 Tax=Gordonia sp. N1V TaxID=3034163 RepID=UPI0023E239C7|nr:hypothetical protein [Gordonia sp. N1V]MDF3285030.1 hypothetical protein [Gordonia sp. N1V]